MIYIALFRGLNVGGNHNIKMADLCAFLNSQGGENTKHYIQSGNLVFKHKADASSLAQKLEPAFEQQFGFPNQIVLRTAEELAAAHAAYPFDSPLRDQKFMMTGFARQTPDENALEVFKDLAGPEELVAQKGQAFFFYFGAGSARSKMANLNFEKKIGTALTLRNRRTVEKLVEMAHAI